MSAKRASKSRPCSTPRRCQPVRFAPATNWPSRSASSATTSPLQPTGPSEPGSAPKAERISSSVASRTSPPSTDASFASSSRSSPRTSASTTAPSRTTGIAFDVAAASMPRNSARALDRADARRLDLVGSAERLRKLGRARNAARDLEVGRVVPPFARDEHVLARPRRCEVVDRLVAAHHPRLRLHGIGLEPAALEHPVVRLEVLAKADVETLVVTVERVGVLHHELAHAEQRSARTRLVAHLRLDVVEDLRQLLVRLQLARVERDRLLVRQREDERAAVAVLDLPELGNVVAPGRLPELRRRDDRHEHLLARRSRSSPRGRSGRPSRGPANRAGGTTRSRRSPVG